MPPGLYPDKVAFPPAEQRKTPAADQQARRFNLREADYSLSLYRTDGTCQISVLLQVFRIRADNGRELTVIAV